MTTWAAVRGAIRDRTAVPSGADTDRMIGQSLVAVLRQLEPYQVSWSVGQLTLTTVADTDYYTSGSGLPADFLSVLYGELFRNSSYDTRIEEVDARTMQEYRHIDAVSSAPYPYAFSQESGGVRLYPTPTQVLSILGRYHKATAGVELGVDSGDTVAIDSATSAQPLDAFAPAWIANAPSVVIGFGTAYFLREFKHDISGGQRALGTAQGDLQKLLSKEGIQETATRVAASIGPPRRRAGHRIFSPWLSS